MTADDTETQRVERPWFVQVESTLANGEDDVMSPEPGEIVWATDADEATDRITTRDYDTNLVLVRPATPDDFAACAAGDDLAVEREDGKLIDGAWVLGSAARDAIEWERERIAQDIEAVVAEYVDSVNSDLAVGWRGGMERAARIARTTR